jgi:hypothetical protein
VISAISGFFREFNLFYHGFLLFKFSLFGYVTWDWQLNGGNYFG